MRKKQILLIIAAILWALVISSSISLAASGQQVKIPYVVSMADAGWWTGIAITNDSGDPITDMKLTFITNNGNSGAFITLKGDFYFEPGPIGPAPIGKVWMSYATDLAEIAGHAQLVDTLAGLYAGEGIKTLPSDYGSVVLSHTGSEQFSVTVYIGSPDGFAYQVFKSESP